MSAQEAFEERTGEAFELDERLTVIGRRLQPGQRAPGFVLDLFDPAQQVMRGVRLADTAGRVRLLNVVNSLDTPVCQVETRHWEQLRAELPPDLQSYTISMDLPFALARWQIVEGMGAGHELLSSHRSEQFGRDYGVLIKEWRLLQRAVFVVGRSGQITYAEYVADQMREPDYAAAGEAILQASA